MPQAIAKTFVSAFLGALVGVTVWGGLNPPGHLVLAASMASAVTAGGAIRLRHDRRAKRARPPR